MIYVAVVAAMVWLVARGKAGLDRTYEWYWDTFWDKGWSILLMALWLTVKIAFCSLCIALPLGILVGLCRTARDPGARLFAFLYVETIRGTPLLVQMMLWFYVIGDAFIDGGLSPFQAGVCALSCFTASYIAEIVRAGIQSIDRGQLEAARSLGLSHAQAMRKVILPQAMRRVLPPLASEFVALVKDSSLASVIGYEELSKRAADISSSYALTYEPWLMAALLYLAVNVTLSLGVRLLEKKLGTESDRGEIR